VAGPRYTIRGGHADADRLERQAEVMAAATAALLDRVGLQPGWACIDFGCGDGQVTVAMAHAVGAGGRAVGIDIDKEAIEIARTSAAATETPIEFACADADTVFEPDAFDLAYARLLLSHLVDPMAALRAMRANVRPGGVVAVEDIFTGTLRSDPPASALDDLQEVYCATVRSHGGDPTIGPRLPALFAGAQLRHVREETVSNPMTTVDHKLFLVGLLDNMRTSILEAKAASVRQLDDLRAGVETAARDPGTVFHQARVHQVWGRR
jgi:ubiquinone/menaquinone biosynthesis C-methylase UbiE